MNFKIDWHPREVAEQWPVGSVVLVRKQQESPHTHHYSYILSLHLTPDALSFDRGHEYALIETPKQKEQQQ